MNIEFLKDYEFFLSLGYVTALASILTMIITQIVKRILKNCKKIYEGMESTEKDLILSRVGRITALVVYTFLYLGNEFYLRHTIILDNALIAGLLSGATLTLTVAKGLYTSLRQHQKKKLVFQKLKDAEKIIANLPKQDIDLKDYPKEIAEFKNRDNNPKKWTLTNKQ